MNKDNPSLEEILNTIARPNAEGRYGREKALDKALQAITKYIEEEKLALLDEVMEKIEGLEVDRDATRKHIEAIALNEGLDDVAIEHRLLDMETDADDRHDVLDDVRQSVESIKAKLRGGGDDNS